MNTNGSSIAASRQLIKEHYNQHVEEGVSTKEALARRREGPAAPLKQYHNEIKRRLIYRCACSRKRPVQQQLRLVANLAGLAEAGHALQLQVLCVSCRFAYGAEALLDYACGRGGDLHKWNSAQVLLCSRLSPTATVMTLSCRLCAASAADSRQPAPAGSGTQRSCRSTYYCQR
eukprot:GHRQ01037998.1.p1 GENE.GHRQ01037998.1~~GHRQ01037998.1.p1  ORF type:complete len:174 (+),score=26.11 GHRQ01037998.1:155-676(+)